MSLEHRWDWLFLIVILCAGIMLYSNFSKKAIVLFVTLSIMLNVLVTMCIAVCLLQLECCMERVLSKVQCRRPASQAVRSAMSLTIPAGTGQSCAVSVVMVEEPPTSFSLFSLVDCMLLSHFSFNNFVAVAFPDLARDLDIQIQISNITSPFCRQQLLMTLLLIVSLFPTFHLQHEQVHSQFISLMFSHLGRHLSDQYITRPCILSLSLLSWFCALPAQQSSLSFLELLA